MDLKINIYYGPRDAFENYISDLNDYSNFIDIIYIHDSYKDKLFEVDMNSGKIQKEIKIAINTIIAYSDEYSLISEGATNAFVSILNTFIFDNLVLHNPPKNILNQLKKKYGKVNEIYYEYNAFDLEKLKEINQLYDKEIIGQGHVKNKLMTAILSNNKLLDKPKPLVIMLYGPSGVGKTETAKLLSEILGQELFRQQLSMFQNNEFISFLFGEAHYKSSFARELLERKSNIILFDEFDKCPTSVYSAFYQMFDEGFFSDKNYNVKLDRTIIICTSNFMSENEIKQKVGEPIFNRFDAIIEFNSLDEEGSKKIIADRYDKYVGCLSDEERQLLEMKNIKNKLLLLSDKFKNFRVLDNYIKELISLAIIERYLN